MTLTKDLYVVVDWAADRWKDAVFSKEEAEKEKELAEKERGVPHQVLLLPDYLKYLIDFYY